MSIGTALAQDMGTNDKRLSRKGFRADGFTGGGR